MKFADLDFKTHPLGLGGVQATVNFSNGYGASVVRSEVSYGGLNGKWELAVFKDGEVTFDTPITDEVLGWLTKGQVTKYLRAIEALEKPEKND